MKNSSQRGFTLLEMLIAMTILATLMLFSNQSIQNGLKAKVKIQEQTEDMSAVRDALRVIEKDVHLAMHFRDIEMEFKQSVQKTSGSSPPPIPPAGSTGGGGSAAAQLQAQQQLQAGINQWMAMDPKRVDPTTDFIGATDQMHFITMNAPRLSEGTPQADFIKVGYYLSDCKKPGATGLSSKCLLRSSDALVEGDVTKNGPSTVLLENVTEFKLQYIASTKQDWTDTWNSKSGEAGSKGMYPESVRIFLTVTKGDGEKKKKIAMNLIAPIHFPNNPPPTGSTTGAPGTNGSGGSGGGQPQNVPAKSGTGGGGI